MKSSLQLSYRLSVLVLLLLSALSLKAQQSSVSVSGNAFDAANPSQRLEDLMVINLRTSQGFFGKVDGSFLISIQPADTIMIASTGYEYKKICFADSVQLPSYQISVPLTRLKVKLKEVVIFSPRELNSIYKDIEKLGYNKRDFQVGGVDAFSSPITFLYQEFSRLEQLKRHNAERINNDKRRELLKQLLATYVSYDIIQLDNDQFDSFIDFCNVPESFMKSASQYDFCIYIKRKFDLFQMERPSRW